MFDSSRQMKGGCDVTCNLLGGSVIRVYREISGAIEGKTLRVEREECGFVLGQRSRILRTAFGSRTAAVEQFVNRKLQKDHTGAKPTEKLCVLRLHKRPSAQCNHHWFVGRAQDGAKGFALNTAEVCFTVSSEDLMNDAACAALNLAIKIHEVPMQETGERPADGALAGRHEAGETQDRYCSGIRAAYIHDRLRVEYPRGRAVLETALSAVRQR
jgi:hypothetical protein